MTATIAFPGARIPFGWATVDGARVRVDLEPEWMLVITRLFDRTGGTIGETSFADIGQLLDAPAQSVELQGALRTLAGLESPPAAPLFPVGRMGDLEAADRFSFADALTLRRIGDLEGMALDARAPVLPAPFVLPTVEGWSIPALSGGWLSFGAPYNAPGYYKDPWGAVRLRGMLKSGAVGSVAFTLPAGYRPAGRERLPCESNSAHGVVEIDSSGTVTLAVGSTSWFSLDGMSFLAA